eukprot:gene47480-58163_t
MLSTPKDVIQVVRRLSHDLREVLSGDPSALWRGGSSFSSRSSRSTQAKEEDDSSPPGPAGQDSTMITITDSFSFRFLWTAHYVLGIAAASVVLYCTHELPAVDALLLAASAMTNSGLSPVAMRRISSLGFAVLAVLMLLGSPVAMLVL